MKSIKTSEFSNLNKTDFVLSFLKFVSNKYFNRIFGKNVFPITYGRKLLTPGSANDCLYQLIQDDKPFIVGRFGTTEMNSIGQVIKNEMGLGKIRELERRSLVINAGFFPDDIENFKRFAALNLELCPHIDMLGILNSRFEDYVIRHFMKDTQIANLTFIEPYYFENPWSKALEDKKVLVIHPFSDTIKSQYQKRHLLYKNPDILPEFELSLIKSVQTVAGNKSEFSTWFHALNSMFEQAMKIQFDIAIIGCGAYGLPLAIKLKQGGKKAVHMGGATQILFGIKGSRWDQHPIISTFYNEYWVRPGKSERPENAGLVEDSCYW
jgi:hypothetical protein